MRTPRRRVVAWTLASIALGGAYGWASARANRNPYYEPGAPAAPLGMAWGWEPSPIWLPSYLLCVVPRNGYGIEHTRSGYLFRSSADRARYVFASTALGVGLGVATAAVSLTLRCACCGRGAKPRHGIPRV